VPWIDLVTDARPTPSETADPPVALRCRFCGTTLRTTFVDLGMSPLCERFLTASQLDEMEPFYPLHVRICESCLLVQLPEYVAPDEIFTEYAYFSSYSDSWVAHARTYTDAVIDRFALGPADQVVEVASNDGYLLQHFVARGIPVLGIEPAKNVAAAGEARGVPAITEFFGAELAGRLLDAGHRADLLVANNVFAHVPAINDFTAGLATLLAPRGVVTLEFPHVVRLIEGRQFDTIYHEHFSYLSFGTARAILAAHGLAVFDVDELATHGGSLRVYACHAGDDTHPVTGRVSELLERERDAGYASMDGYLSFGPQVEATKRALLSTLIALREAGHSIAGYGAPGKGNTLLNFCGIRTDLVDYLVDRNTYKHGRFTPGTHIPIHDPGRLAETQPDVVLLLPWNLRQELVAQLAYVRDWGGRMLVPIPEPAFVA
jgi:SAM-dependent methyltransferase